MGRRSELSIFLLCLSWGTVQSVMYYLRGEKAQLVPGILTQPPKSFLWKCNGNKVVEFTGQEELPYGSYEGRITLDWHTAQLEISGLRFEDSGKYEYEIEVDNRWHTASYDLEVIEKVIKPAVTCEINNSSSSSTVSAELLCSVEPNQHYSPLMFEWHSDGKIHLGETLTIFLGGELDEQQYTCQVSNPVSHETVTFTAKDCNKGSSAGIVTLIVLVVLGACVVLLTVLYCLKKRELACFTKRQKPDLENPKLSKAPPKKSLHDDRSHSFASRATLPSSRPLASHQGLHEETHRGEERKPLLQAHGVNSKAQGSSQGNVKGKAMIIEERERNLKENTNTFAQKKTGLEQKFQKQDQTVEFGEQSTVSNPPLKQLAKSDDSETEDNRVPQENGGDLFTDDKELLPPTQNSANLTPEDGNSEHEDQNTDSGSDKQEKHNILDHSNKETSTTSEGGAEPNGSQEETQTNEEKQQKSELLSQETTEKREDHHKTDGDESDHEDEEDENINVVDETKISTDLNNLSETIKGEEDSNLSQAEVTNAEDNQEKNNHEHHVDEDQVTKEDDVVEEAETSSHLDHPTEKKDLDLCNQKAEEKSEKEPESPQENTDKSEDCRHKTDGEESENDEEAKSINVVEEAETSSDLDHPTEKKDSDHCNQKAGEKSGKQPVSPQENIDKNEEDQLKTESENEDEVKTNVCVAKEAEVSSDLDNTSTEV